MDMIGQVVFSKRGRDAGRLYVVTGMMQNFCCIADGRYRKLQNPKKKNPRHLVFTGDFLEPDQYQFNKTLWKALKNLEERKVDRPDAKGGNADV